MDCNMTERRKSRILVETEYAVFIFFVALFRRLSLNNAYRFVTVLADIFYFLDFKHRNRCVTHMLYSGIVSNSAEAKKLTRRNFRNMLKVFVEIVKFRQIVDIKRTSDYLVNEVEDEACHNCMEPGNSRQIILATAHLGNWELAGNMYSLHTGMTLCSIMRPLTNPKIGDFVCSMRAGINHYNVSREKGIKPLLHALNKGESIAIVADQHASRSEGVEVSFFGKPARAHASVALLHLKTGVPIAPCFLIRKSDGFNFVVKGGPLIEYKPTADKEADIKAVTQMFTDAIENVIRQYPEQWLWAHRRWLYCNRKKRKENTENA